MKYCPQCNRRFPDAWITFCTDDGSLLRDELTPPADPNWDPRIRQTQYDDPSENPTQWLPYDTPRSGGWMAPDERGPVERPWQPPPPPPQPYVRPGTGPPGIAVASMVVGLAGVMFGFFCGAPVPGIVAVILGVIALRQMTNAPNPAGRSMAIAGIVLGGINLVFFAFWLLWGILSIAFG
jgi:hypothetical protein